MQRIKAIAVITFRQSDLSKLKKRSVPLTCDLFLNSNLMIIKIIQFRNHSKVSSSYLMEARVIEAALYPISKSGLTADPALPMMGTNMVKVV